MHCIFFSLLANGAFSFGKTRSSNPRKKTFFPFFALSLSLTSPLFPSAFSTHTIPAYSPTGPHLHARPPRRRGDPLRRGLPRPPLHRPRPDPLPPRPQLPPRRRLLAADDRGRARGAAGRGRVLLSRRAEGAGVPERDRLEARVRPGSEGGSGEVAGSRWREGA